jgi:small subunit ribosomal protein S10
MSFVTRLTFTSGDRATLDDVVGDVKDAARRKGVELNGPHATPPENLRVPLHRTVAGERAFTEWSYTVYARRVDVVGHQAFAQSLAKRSYPDGVHVAVEVEQQSPMS